jgi:two-component system C4-dicarboxylate transport response regulator DctD
LTGSEKVLIVEDDPLIVLALEEVLTAAGFIVTAVATAAEALAVSQLGMPDLAIFDIRLPGQQDGVTGAGVIRAMAQSLPILFLTGEIDPAVTRRAAEIAGAVFVRKPAHPHV